MKLSKNKKESIITVDKKEKDVDANSSKTGDMYVKSSANIRMNEKPETYPPKSRTRQKCLLLLLLFTTALEILTRAVSQEKN